MSGSPPDWEVGGLFRFASLCFPMGFKSLGLKDEVIHPVIRDVR